MFRSRVTKDSKGFIVEIKLAGSQRLVLDLRVTTKFLELSR